jgi:hypothetical protein
MPSQGSENRRGYCYIFREFLASVRVVRPVKFIQLPAGAEAAFQRKVRVVAGGRRSDQVAGSL